MLHLTGISIKARLNIVLQFFAHIRNVQIELEEPGTGLGQAPFKQGLARSAVASNAASLKERSSIPLAIYLSMVFSGISSPATYNRSWKLKMKSAQL